MSAFSKEIRDELALTGKVERTVTATWSIVVCVIENDRELEKAERAKLQGIGINAYVEVGEAE